MESEKIAGKMNENNVTSASDELANLKRISDVENFVKVDFDDLRICTAGEEHVKEIAELWANLASVQQISAPERYNFKAEGKDWQAFVRRKLAKKHNLLLVIHKTGSMEVRGFLYLQTIVIPSSDLVLKGVIEEVYTKPQYRKQGIGSKLLEVALEWASSQNIKQIDFVTLANTKGVADFYFKFLKSFKTNLNLELLTM